MSKKDILAKVGLTDNDISQLLAEEKFSVLKEAFIDIDPADVADIFGELSSKELDKLFHILAPDLASDVILEMEPEDVEDVVDVLAPNKLADIIGEMAPDDAVDFYSSLDQEEQNAVLLHLNDKDRQKLKELLEYEEDSAGGLMTPELCAVTDETTVEQCINLIAQADFSDPISLVFVVDKNRLLIGSIAISELLAEARNCKMKDLNRLDTNTVYALVNEDQESIARKFRKYDLYAMPVLNENNKLIGRITADDVMDVMHEEADEDIAHMAGAPDIEHHVESPLAIVKLRLPWLMITMGAGMLVSIIVNGIINIEGAAALTAFVPVIMAMGGNTGMQASAVTIRSIALGQIEFDKLFSVFMREVKVGATMGIICGMIAGLLVILNLHLVSNAIVDFPHVLKFACIVAAAMTTAMTFASFAGTVLPILLHKFEIDPAVASGPFVTTGNDLSASLIYFLMCYILINN